MSTPPPFDITDLSNPNDSDDETPSSPSSTAALQENPAASAPSTHPHGAVAAVGDAPQTPMSLPDFLLRYGRGGVPDAAAPTSYKLAIVLGHLLHPATIAVPVAVYTGLQRQGHMSGRFMVAAIMLTIICIGFPLAWIFLLQRMGGLGGNDIHMRTRKNRLVFYPVALGAVTTAWMLFTFLFPFRIAEAMTAASMAVVTLLWITTLGVKSSLHCAGDTSIALGVLLVYGPKGWPLVLAPIVVTWARIRAGRHTPLETAIGHLIGLIGTAVVVGLFYPDIIAAAW